MDHSIISYLLRALPPRSAQRSTPLTSRCAACCLRLAAPRARPLLDLGPSVLRHPVRWAARACSPDWRCLHASMRALRTFCEGS